MGRGGEAADRDARVLAWLTAPEGASARPVLDATFAELPRIRQDAWRPWTPLLDALSRPTSLELPRWAWIALVLLLLLAISISTLTIAGRLRPFLDRLSALPALPAAMVEVAVPARRSRRPGRCGARWRPSRNATSARTDPTSRVFVATFPAGTDHAVAGAAPIVVPITFDPYGEKTMLDLATSANDIGRPGHRRDAARDWRFGSRRLHVRRSSRSRRPPPRPRIADPAVADVAGGRGPLVSRPADGIGHRHGGLRPRRAGRGPRVDSTGPGREPLDRADGGGRLAAGPGAPPPLPRPRAGRRARPSHRSRARTRPR